jgi:hypothetical protein
MAQRRFGPTLDAGTVIIEKEAEKAIQAHALGCTAYTGILERGTVGDLIITSGKKDLLAKTGGLIPDSLLPDAAQDFWDYSKGAGILFLYRVDDGTGVKAELQLWDRKAPRNKVIKVEADNVGKWAGATDAIVADLTDVSLDIAETTVQMPLGLLMPVNKWKGGQLTLTGSSKTYNIISNTVGNATTRATITLAADSKAKTDFGAATDKECTLVKSNADAWGRARHLAIEILDGQLNPGTEWGMKVYVNDELVKTYPDLSSDPNSASYFAEIINRDLNGYIKVTDQWTGAITADVRPANWFGSLSSSEISEQEIDLATALVRIDASLAGTNTLASFTFGTQVVPDTYELEVMSIGPTVWELRSLSRQTKHTFTAPTDGAAYPADNPFSIGFTATGVTPVVGEKWTLYVLPLVEDEAINGSIFFPEVSGAPKGGWYITDNNETTVDIGSGDLTLGGGLPGTVKVRLQYRQKMWFGYDGIYALADAHFTAAYDPNTSPFNKTEGQGYGLIKHATPGVWALTGVDATVVQKAGKDYAETKNHQYRGEFEETVVDEFVAKAYLNDTLGRSDYLKMIFPSYARVSDPVKSGLLKLVSITGMVHGLEAKTAKDYDGYHKVAAGIYTGLSRIKQLPTGDTRLNGEVLNPAGIQRVERRAGNFVVWGARLGALDQAWKWSQQRESLSYYEHVLAESFDWIIFAINDPVEQAGAIAAVQSFFMPEWRKRALRGDTFEDACQIKCDDENNTDATRAAGDMNMEITLQLADTIERFIISIGKMGIFESTAG